MTDPGTTPPPDSAGDPHAPDDISRLHARIAVLERERTHLVAVVEILQEISATLHFVDILQTIARRLGESFGLDRCSIFLSGEHEEARLVASYEDPSIRNLVVDLNRYPELKRAFESGETVFIPDAPTDPQLAGIRSELDARNVRSIVVVPIRWQGAVIGAIFLRTQRDQDAFSDEDVGFCQVIASLTAKALRNAHRYEAMARSQAEQSAAARRAELQRIALIAYLRRLLDRYTHSEGHMWAETLLPKASDEELERLVGVTMQVLDEESKG